MTLAKFALCISIWAICDSCAASTCELERPPRAATATGVHGQYIFIYPNSIPERFSGCQTVWTETGHKWLVYRFQNGVLEQLTVDYPKSNRAQNRNVDCYYSNGKTLDRTNDECVMEEISPGFPHIDTTVPEPEPPPDRDPRQ